MTDYDRIITAIKADIEKQKETAVNPSARIFIGGEMRAIEIIEELKMESAGTQITNSNLKSESEIKVDLIRREAVLDTLDRMNKALDTDRTVEQYHKLLKACFEVLPAYSANLVKESGVLVKDLVKDGDLISRKAMLDMLEKIDTAVDDGEGFQYQEWVDYVEELPTIPQTDLELVDKKRLLNKMWRDFWAMEDKKTEEQGADYVGLPRLYEQNGFDCALRTVVDFPTIPQTDSSVIAKIKMWSESPEYSYGEKNVMKVILQELEDTIPQTDLSEIKALLYNIISMLSVEDVKLYSDSKAEITITPKPQTDSVLEEIKTEISQINTNYCGGYWGLSKQEVIDIIDKHIRGKE